MSHLLVEIHHQVGILQNKSTVVLPSTENYFYRLIVTHAQDFPPRHFEAA